MTRRLTLLFAAVPFFVACGDSTGTDGGTDDALVLDISMVVDMAVKPPDLVSTPDLVTPADLTVLPDLTTPADLTMKNTFDIFIDAYGMGITYAPFGGSMGVPVIDMVEHQSGTASLRIDVPNSGYIGGAFVPAAPVDVSKYNAVSFWMKSSKPGPVDTFGIGNDAMANALQTEIHATATQAGWTQYYLPIPDPTKATKLSGLFHFAQGGNGPYSIWLDNIQYVTVPAMMLGTPAPAFATQTVMKSVGDTVAIPGIAATWMIGGAPVTETPMGTWFTWTSSMPAIASVDATGLVTALAVGSADITGSMGGVAAGGKFTVQVAAAMAPNAAPARPALAAANVISLFSDAYTNVMVDSWNTVWSSAKEMDVKIGGDDMKKYTSLVFNGVETTTKVVDATNMTAWHMDVWTPDSTVWKIKLVDFGADGMFGGGDDTECEIAFDKNSAAPNTLVLSSWIGFEVPLASFQNAANCTEGGGMALKAQAHVAQYIFSGSNSTAFVDNVYFHK